MDQTRLLGTGREERLRPGGGACPDGDPPLPLRHVKERGMRAATAHSSLVATIGESVREVSLPLMPYV